MPTPKPFRNVNLLLYIINMIKPKTHKNLIILITLITLITFPQSSILPTPTYGGRRNTSQFTAVSFTAIHNSLLIRPQHDPILPL